MCEQQHLFLTSTALSNYQAIYQIAMHEADMSSLKDDTMEDVSLNASVMDNFTQLTDAMEDLAKDMGIEAKFKF
ncbi:hypothetical protein [Weissella paramesenteroides]|uniref:hypothetical protein n=1 Tax=Weissella paramesenteroides TaxID=1249 RepID=UPI0012399607|nr:hypothetical protein [Weissella paramesenteroides]